MGLKDTFAGSGGWCGKLPVYSGHPLARSFLMDGVVRNLLLRLPPETAHNVTLNSLDVAQKLGMLNVFSKHPAPSPVNVMGLEFPNPVGLAAGLAKNADHLDALGALGFGFIEVGTVAPLAQPGNPQPQIGRAHV